MEIGPVTLSGDGRNEWWTPASVLVHTRAFLTSLRIILATGETVLVRGRTGRTGRGTGWRGRRWDASRDKLQSFWMDGRMDEHSEGS